MKQTNVFLLVATAAASYLFAGMLIIGLIGNAIAPHKSPQDAPDTALYLADSLAHNINVDTLCARVMRDDVYKVNKAYVSKQVLVVCTPKETGNNGYYFIKTYGLDTIKNISAVVLKDCRQGQKEPTDYYAFYDKTGNDAMANIDSHMPGLIAYEIADAIKRRAVFPETVEMNKEYKRMGEIRMGVFQYRVFYSAKNRIGLSVPGSAIVEINRKGEVQSVALENR